MGCNASAIWRAHKRGAYFANPSWTQIHPTSLPQSGEYQSKLTLMSEEQGKNKIAEKYGNLFRMYEKITGISAYQENSAFAAAEEVARRQLQRLLDIQGTLPVDYFHKSLGRILYRV